MILEFFTFILGLMIPKLSGLMRIVKMVHASTIWLRTEGECWLPVLYLPAVWAASTTAYTSIVPLFAVFRQDSVDQ
jgi:hypothetical protein